MSDTIKHKYTSEKPKNRANILGLCKCRHCKRGRQGKDSRVQRMNKKIRLEGKGKGKPFVKGVFTD